MPSTYQNNSAYCSRKRKPEIPLLRLPFPIFQQSEADPEVEKKASSHTKAPFKLPLRLSGQFSQRNSIFEIEEGINKIRGVSG